MIWYILLNKSFIIKANSDATVFKAHNYLFLKPACNYFYSQINIFLSSHMFSTLGNIAWYKKSILEFTHIKITYMWRITWRTPLFLSENCTLHKTHNFLIVRIESIFKLILVALYKVVKCTNYKVLITIWHA